MINKTIHYCWFGRNKKSGLIENCIESWKKYLPNYEIIEWNEENFDIDSNLYVSEAYKAKKWAFVSDYVRLWALYNYGGLYFDTDVEVLKGFDVFLSEHAFSGYESNNSLTTAVIGAEKGDKLINKLLDYYTDRHFDLGNGLYDTKTNTDSISEQMISWGMHLNGRKQTFNGFTVYPQIYFCPNNFTRIWNKPSPKSYAIHHFDQSWRAKDANHTSLKGRIKRYIVGVARNLLGDRLFIVIVRRLKNE